MQGICMSKASEMKNNNNNNNNNNNPKQPHYCLAVTKGLDEKKRGDGALPSPGSVKPCLGFSRWFFFLFFLLKYPNSYGYKSVSTLITSQFFVKERFFGVNHQKF